MNFTPKIQTKIYGLKKNLNEIINLFNADKFPNKILLSGPKGIGKSTMAYHFINYVFSKNETYSYNLQLNEINVSNKSFKLIEKGSHPNFYLIDLDNDKKNIEISQIRKMIEYTNKSSFNNLPKLILIDNVENLNKNSINSLLKLIEEPNHNVFFILVHNSNHKLLATLKSRCLLFKISLTFDESIKITNKLLNDNIFNLLHKDLISHYNTPGNYIKLINFSKENDIKLNEYNLKSFLLLLINERFYKNNNFIKFHIYNYIELYFLMLFNQTISKNEVLNLYTKFINKIYNTNTFNLDYESLFIEFKSKVLNE
tara:strand:+ start:3534 stop:4472 length:939 start_codon:yes stop_codon:yes gene_type:complete